MRQVEKSLLTKVLTDVYVNNKVVDDLTIEEVRMYDAYYEQFIESSVWDKENHPNNLTDDELSKSIDNFDYSGFIKPFVDRV